MESFVHSPPDVLIGYPRDYWRFSRNVNEMLKIILKFTKLEN